MKNVSSAKVRKLQSRDLKNSLKHCYFCFNATKLTIFETFLLAKGDIFLGKGVFRIEKSAFLKCPPFSFTCRCYVLGP